MTKQQLHSTNNSFLE